ncbi:MAG: PAS domain S-box protein [Hyphomonadaceae bacterium]|nr:MAG: multi-sensor hybrid histidine kinase [Caulobacteraceae bacterium]MBT9446763.1 PAS domain S-box protein [Hyphomonadaceae bacterium]TPW03542.1 MAG: multi-sensor hybrid histidine kinase [Alphaproteobacteria bacterium]
MFDDVPGAMIDRSVWTCASADALYRVVFTAMTEGVVIHAPDGAIVDANPAAERLLGLTRDQILGRTSTDPLWRAVREDGTPFPGEDHPAMVALRSGEPQRDITMGVQPSDAPLRWLRVNAEPFVGTTGERNVVAVFHDISEKVQSRDKLAEQNFMLENILTAMSDRVALVRADGRVIYRNPAATMDAAEHAPPVLESFWRGVDALTPDGAPIALEDRFPNRALRGESIEATELILQPAGRPDRRLHVVMSARPMRNAAGEIESALLVYRDISAMHKLQEERAAAQKMQALGQLTGGVAHDFNNLLTAIVQSIALVQDGCKGDPHLERLTGIIAKAAKRGGDLTRNLLAFSRQQVLEPRDVDVHALIDETTMLLRPIIGGSIDLDIRLNATHTHATVDPGQLTTALINLAVNARDAMDNRGVLRIETRDHPADDTPEIEIAFSDSGPGIPPDLRERVFEPFFTTKPEGQGTGLGLSMVHGFAHQSGGRIVVDDSADLSGARVSIILPAA